ncbi:MAG: ABC transporter substrate-binding protein [Lachnospiraceae bacterium]|jgi:iron complex transport system substrate-binding protein
MRKIWKKSMAVLTAAALTMVSLSGCQSESKEETAAETVMEAAGGKETESKMETEASDKEETGSITVTDQAGREVTLDAPAERIVSSYYISTALLIALGCEDELVGIEMKGDTRPLYQMAAPQLLELPAIGSGKGINVEETAALEPDVVIIPKRLEESAAVFETLEIPVVIVNPETQDEFEDCVALLAEITGTEVTGEELLNYYHEKMEFASQLTKDAEKPSVYLASGSDYLSTCTSKMYQNDLISMAGGISVSAELEDSYWAAISAEQLTAWNPDYIFAVSYAEYGLDSFTENEALAEVEAVKQEQVFTFPSKIEAWDYPTPSSVLGVLWLTNALHPDLYSEEEYKEEATEFYQKFFDISVSDEDLGLQ